MDALAHLDDALVKVWGTCPVNCNCSAVAAMGKMTCEGGEGTTTSARHGSGEEFGGGIKLETLLRRPARGWLPWSQVRTFVKQHSLLTLNSTLFPKAVSALRKKRRREMCLLNVVYPIPQSSYSIPSRRPSCPRPSKTLFPGAFAGPISYQVSAGLVVILVRTKIKTHRDAEPSDLPNASSAAASGF